MLIFPSLDRLFAGAEGVAEPDALLRELYLDIYCRVCTQVLAVVVVLMVV